MERTNGATVTIPAREVHLKIVNVDTKDIVPSDPEQHNLNHRAEHFVEMQKQGRTIPPILVHRLPSGKYEVIDGHARLEAYKRTGVKNIPVVENSVSEVLGRIAHGIGHGVSGASKGFTSGLSAPKEGFGHATRIGSTIGAGARKAAGFGVKTVKFGAKTTARTVSVTRRGIAKHRIESKGERYKMLRNLSHSKNPVVRKEAKAKLRKEFPDVKEEEE